MWADYSSLRGFLLTFLEKWRDRDCVEKAKRKLSFKKINDALLEIGDREALIIRLRFGYGSKVKRLSLEDIGKQVNLSRERVRQLEDRGLQRLGRIIIRVCYPY